MGHQFPIFNSSGFYGVFIRTDLSSVIAQILGVLRMAQNLEFKGLG